MDLEDQLFTCEQIPGKPRLLPAACIKRQDAARGKGLVAKDGGWRFVPFSAKEFCLDCEQGHQIKAEYEKGVAMDWIETQKDDVVITKTIDGGTVTKRGWPKGKPRGEKKASDDDLILTIDFTD